LIPLSRSSDPTSTGRRGVDQASGRKTITASGGNDLVPRR
jgi:hypothetical protein